MRTKIGFLACSLFLTVLVAAAQAPKPKEEHHTVTELLNRNISNMEHEFVPAAEAMPEDKFGFAPSNGEFKGVRTFAQQVKHVAAVNYMVFASILGEKIPVDIGGENGPEAMKSGISFV